MNCPDAANSVQVGSGAPARVPEGPWRQLWARRSANATNFGESKADLEAFWAPLETQEGPQNRPREAQSALSGGRNALQMGYQEKQDKWMEI